MLLQRSSQRCKPTVPPTPSLRVLHWGGDIFRQNAPFCADSISTVPIRDGGGRGYEQPGTWHLGCLELWGQGGRTRTLPCGLWTSLPLHLPVPLSHISLTLGLQGSAKRSHLLPCPPLSEPFCPPGPSQQPKCLLPCIVSLVRCILCLLRARSFLEARDMEVTNKALTLATSQSGRWITGQ